MGEYTVYKHTSPSEKVYIGITKQDPKNRFNGGRGYKQNPYFSNAIAKYGWDSFIHEILVAGLTKREAEEMERHFIEIHDSTNPDHGYNLSLGGESGAKFTDASKQKISMSLKEYYATHPDAIENMRTRQTGKRAPDEVRAKMSESHKNRTTPEIRKRMSESRKGKPCPHGGHEITVETRKKISESKKGKHYGGNGKVPTPVQCVETGVVYKSAMVASNDVGVAFTSIYRCCKGERKTAMGYTWRYAI